MQGLYNNSLNIPSIYQQANYILDPMMTNLNGQELFSLLVGHKQMIQKLLENQNILKGQFYGAVRTQTTDTDHSQHQIDFQPIIQNRQRSQNLCKTVQNILLKQERPSATIQNRALKKVIQIVSTCPILQNLTSESFQQKEQIQQLQKTPEQNKKCCETKNIIKNYGKSILMFLRRRKPLVKKVLDFYGQDQIQFYNQFEKFKDRVNSITDLKLFWTKEGNRFARIYRIISNIYLKQHSLKHTFSSRVKNYAVHIKYRKRLLDVIKNPMEFSSIKYL